ncbi:MAG: hypothetical protein JO246_07815 [Frankiaceae bacterium]|nr:hypothetical protein [Frankiaceae bacterium]MBV9869913.1 hypothetical protein [Frankiaceae bacterium]
MPNRPTADRFHAPPERSADFAHLSLDGLRQYRSTLSSEESRVSYWRRIIQARLDLVRAADAGSTTTVDDLPDVFAEGRGAGARTALITIVPVDDMPPLPDLGAIWAREPIVGNREHNNSLIHDLTKAESQLSAYRAALHRRLASATSELIARYRESPNLCLTALPGGGPDRKSAAH